MPVPSRRPPTLQRRVFRGSAVVAAGLLVPEAIVSGRSAAVLWGLPEAERDDDVELTVPPGSTVSRVSGLRVRRRLLSHLHRPEQLVARLAAALAR